MYTLFSDIELDFSKNIIKSSQRIDFICDKCHKHRLAMVSTLIDGKSLTCGWCKTKEKNLKEHGTIGNSKSSIEKAKVSRKNSCLEKYGVENVFQVESSKEKRRKSLLQKYGVDSPLKNDKIKSKMSLSYLNTMQEKYGVNNPAQLNSIKEKIKDTVNKRYGVDFTFQSNEVKENIKKTLQNRYGETNISKVDSIKKKKESLSLKRYGTKTPLQAEEVKSKIKATCLQKYGATNPNKNNSIRDRIKSTCLSKYGVSCPLQIPSSVKKAFSSKGDSGPEKKLYEALYNRKFNFKHNYEINNKNFDFAIFDDLNNLKCLVEIDGIYFHGLKSDYDGKHVRGESDSSRFEKVPEGVKFIVCDENKVEECFKEICSIFNVSYDDWISSIFNSLPQEFPYPSYSNERMTKDYKSLSEYSNIDKKAFLGMSIIRNFHKSIYSAKRDDKPSPLEAWNNKALLLETVKNRWIYKSNLSSQNIADGFNVCKIAPKVSVFNPCTAKILVQKYLQEYNVIFDPFSGFSGRMLGACSLGKTYIGQDINKEHVDESNEIIKFLNLDASVSQKDLFESSGEYECLFTCPPYNLKETWNNDNQANLSCDEWIDECMKRFKCKKYLFIVDKTEKYKDKIVEEIKNKSHFGENSEYIVLI
jgi:hypothetical protein